MTYLIPVTSPSDIWIESVVARSITDAQDKFIHLFVDDYDLDYPADFKELEEYLADKDVYLGIIYDKDEF